MTKLELKIVDYKKNLEEVDFNLVLKNIHNNIYANDGLMPSESLNFIINLLFLKSYNELKLLNSFYISHSEYLEIINGKKNNDFTARIENLRIQTFEHFKEIFIDDKKFNIKDITLAFAVKSLSVGNILNSYDVFGKAFLQYLSSTHRNTQGQFFTPDEIVNFCINFLKPKKIDNIIDPACGSGSFLISAIKYIKKKKEKNITLNNIYGIEINSVAAKIAKLNILLSNGNYKNIINKDALIDIDKINVIEPNFKEHFDIIITNPPFGTGGKISSKAILKNYKLACRWIENEEGFLNSEKFLDHQVPEILFLERCIELLKFGGKMAIILPNGNLENPTLRFLRYYISYYCNVLAIVKLPQDAFVHSGTGIKTSILFLEKKKFPKINIKNSNPIFFSQIKKIGFSANKAGKKIYKKDNLGNTIRDNKNNPIIDEDISEVLADYTYATNEKKLLYGNSFLIQPNEFSYNRYNYEFYDPKFKKIYLNFNKNNSFLLKDLVDMKKKKSSKLLSPNLIVSYVELSDVISDYSEIYKSEMLKVFNLPSRASYDLNEGDLITSVSGNSIGTKRHASAIVSSKFHGSICSNGFRVFSDFSKKINKFYLIYYFKTNMFLDQIFRLRTGSAIPSIQDNDLLNIKIFVPSAKKISDISKVIEKGFKDREIYKNEILKI
jgi:type I restriction enzyme M protein